MTITIQARIGGTIDGLTDPGTVKLEPLTAGTVPPHSTSLGSMYVANIAGNCGIFDLAAWISESGLAQGVRAVDDWAVVGLHWGILTGGPGGNPPSVFTSGEAYVDPSQLQVPPGYGPAFNPQDLYDAGVLTPFVCVGLFTGKVIALRSDALAPVAPEVNTVNFTLIPLAKNAPFCAVPAPAVIVEPPA